MRALNTSLFLLALTSGVALAAEEPLVELDLMRTADAAKVNVAWKYHDVDIVPTKFFLPNREGQPGDESVATLDIEPHAGAREFDDSGWAPIAPEELAMRRGHGRLSFNWYRATLVLPEKIDDIAVAGKQIDFEAVVDDYAEIWADGELLRRAGEGGAAVAGWNAGNRVVLARNAKPGQRITLAIFGMNGPISATPTNFIYFHQARLRVFPGTSQPRAIVPAEVNIEVERHDPEVDQVISHNPKLFKLAEGFQFTEGPLWLPEGTLLFSDPNANRIYKYRPATATLEVFREQSGYSGKDIGEYGQPGSNGLALDPAGPLTINEHGNHRVSQLTADGQYRTLVASYDGKRLNSPNDLVFKADGALYFTDPPFGLPKFADDPRKELAYSGIFRWQAGTLTLLDTSLKGPNGIAFSPDEKYLYVTNWDEARKVVMRYPVRTDGTLDPGSVFFDMASAPGAEALDGIKIDRDGRLYVSGPGGLWIIAADGRHLGTLKTPQLPANFAWGEQGHTLFLTARTGLYRLPLLTQGTGQW